MLLPIVILGIGFFLVHRSIAKRRDLKETLLWIDQTYNPHEGGDNLSQGHGWEIHYVRKGGVEEVSEKFGMTLSRDDSCNIVLHTESPAVGVFSEISSVTTYTLSLCDVDPESIKIKTFDMHKDVFDCANPEEVKLYDLSRDNAEIEFLTRNGAPTVSVNNVNTYLKLTGSDHEGRNVSKANKAWLLVDDVPYAQRLAKALKHAVELCGGKTSKF